MAGIWEKDLWINPNIPYLFNRQIIEYDMKSAGLSLIQEYKMLPQEEIAKLQKLGKQDLNRKIGLMERENKELIKQKKEAFKSVREEFFARNGLSEENIVSIKKDAIFSTKECKNTKIGSYILFREKNRYSSYIKIGTRRLELYYAQSKLDVKGIGDENLQLHQNGMIAFFNQFFRRVEMEKAESTLIWMRSFIDSYKHMELPIEYYRQFNAKSAYVLNTEDEYMDFWEEEKNRIDIRYNYFILMELLKILL